MIRTGERVPDGDHGERIVWSLDWLALQVAFHVQHPLLAGFDPADVFDAMLMARNAANTSSGERVRELMDADGD
jgi:hypothetical protein